MNLRQFLRGLATLAICALAYSSAGAQTPPAERAAGGNAPSASAGARIDMTNESVRRFIAGQEGLITGVQTTVNTTNTSILARLGQMRNTLVNFTPVAGCDPELGPHGCACACSGDDQKLLWNGTRWQCYRAEQRCPSVPRGQKPYRFNPETCQCEICDECPVLVCEPPLFAIETGGTTSCGGRAGECACISSGRRPHYGLDPDLTPWIDSFSVDSIGCPTNVQCKNNLQYSEQKRSCCCGRDQALLNDSCGNVCPDGTIFQGGPGAGYTLTLGYCFTPEYRIVQTQQECVRGNDEIVVGNGPETCGGGTGICCQHRTRVPYTPFGGGEYMGCVTR